MSEQLDYLVHLTNILIEHGGLDAHSARHHVAGVTTGILIGLHHADLARRFHQAITEAQPELRITNVVDVLEQTLQAWERETRGSAN